MKNQAIEINFTVVLYAGIMYTGLVISGWLLLRLTVACFKLPSMLTSGQLLGRDAEDEIEMMQQALIKEEEVNEDSSPEMYFDTLTQQSCNNTILNKWEGEKRGRKRNVGGKRSNVLDVIAAEAELITKGLVNADEVDGRRTTRSSTRGSTAASKLKNEPPAKKEKKTPAVKGKRGRPKVVAKEESEEVVSAEENGIAENDVDSKADKGGSSTEEEVDSKTDEKIENGNTSAEEEKKDESKESDTESEKLAVTGEKKESLSP